MKTISKRQFLKQLGGLAAFSFLSSCSNTCRQPNILFAISDDQSWLHTGIGGCKYVNTPGFDRIAREGVLFTNAYSAAPHCSPSRAAILTGRHIWQLEEAGTHASSFPRKYKSVTELLASNGYEVGYTGKPWGPGNWKVSGWVQNPVGPEFNEITMPVPEGVRDTDYSENFKAFLQKRDLSKPFFFWYGASEPHRPYLKGIGLKQGKRAGDVKVPGFLPDTPEIRSDLLDYAFEIDWFDSHLVRILDTLEKQGELDNTLVIVTSDNGMPFPRAKANMYEFGVHLPLAMRWPRKIRSGRVVDDLVSFVDFGPTLLNVAGLSVHPQMTGKSLLNLLKSKASGSIDTSREFVLSGRERHTHARPDNLGYPSRAIRFGEYLYIHNFAPDRWPAGNPTGSGEPEGYHDIDPCPTKTFMLENRLKYEHLFNLAVQQRPMQELYNVVNDPDCINNLANDPDYKETTLKLKDKLFSKLTEQQDPRVMGNGDIFESYPRFSPMRQFKGFKKRDEYNPRYQ